MSAFSYFSTNPTSPATEHFVIVPDNSVNFEKPCKAFYVGEGGDVSVVDTKGTTVLYRNIGVGIWPIAAIRINASGTTAGSLVGFAL